MIKTSKAAKKLKRCNTCGDVSNDVKLRLDWSPYATMERPKFSNDRLHEFVHRLDQNQYLIKEKLLVPNGRIHNIPRTIDITKDLNQQNFSRLVKHQRDRCMSLRLKGYLEENIADETAYLERITRMYYLAYLDINV